MNSEPIAPLDLYRAAMGANPRRAPMAEHMNMTLIEADHGRIVVTSVPEQKYYNPMGSIHGGYYATLLDTAMSCAVHTACKPGFTYTTLEFKVTLVRAMTEATGVVRCEGQILNVDNRVGYAEGRILDAAGKVYAHGTTTCLIFAS